MAAESTPSNAPVVPEQPASDVEKEQTAEYSKDIGSVDYYTAEDRRILRKVDLRLLPILTLLYLLSFLDRSNVGNAKLDGLITDTHTPAAAYNTGLALYFIGYVTFEVPANIVLKRFDPKYWLPLLTFVWGIVAIFQGFAGSESDFLGLRWLMGATEAGLFPGVVYLFSVYYRRDERHWRVALFFGGAALAGAFGGVFAYAIGLMDGVGGKSGWSWIFIIEGLLTIVVSAAGLFFVPTWSHKATFLTTAERGRLLERLAADSDAGKDEAFSWVYVRQALFDPLVWGYALSFHGFAFVLYSLSLFLPTIIVELGFATWKAQLMTTPPNVLATIGIIFGAWISARTKRRALWIIVFGSVAIIGYIILASTTRPGPQYLGVHLAALGVYSGNALILSWPAENISGQTKRAVGVAMQITIGDLGAVVGVLIYRPAFAGHDYRKPHIIAIGYIVFALAIVGTLWAWMAGENRRRDALVRDADQDEKTSKRGEIGDEGSVNEVLLGDRNVKWRYQI